jgi:hypothetical protein
MKSGALLDRVLASMRKASGRSLDTGREGIAGDPVMNVGQASEVRSTPDQFRKRESMKLLALFVFAAFAYAEVPDCATCKINVPEPSTWALMALGLGGIAVVGWRKRK